MLIMRNLEGCLKNKIFRFIHPFITTDVLSHHETYQLLNETELSYLNEIKTVNNYPSPFTALSFSGSEDEELSEDEEFSSDSEMSCS